MRVTVLLDEETTTSLGDITEIITKASGTISDRWDDLGMLTADVDEGGKEQIERLEGVTVLEQI